MCACTQLPCPVFSCTPHDPLFPTTIVPPQQPTLGCHCPYACAPLCGTSCPYQCLFFARLWNSHSNFQSEASIHSVIQTHWVLHVHEGLPNLNASDTSCRWQRLFQIQKGKNFVRDKTYLDKQPREESEPANIETRVAQCFWIDGVCLKPRSFDLNHVPNVWSSLVKYISRQQPWWLWRTPKTEHHRLFYATCLAPLICVSVRQWLRPIWERELFEACLAERSRHGFTCGISVDVAASSCTTSFLEVSTNRQALTVCTLPLGCALGSA